LASKSYKINETEIPIAYLDKASEIFITSSTKGVLSVINVDGKIIGTGKPGPVTTALLSAWEKHVQTYIHHQTSQLVK
jgi:branched-subunit amino acid aminotransferase/4-amino-4-deoxychorismate lyase